MLNCLLSAYPENGMTLFNTLDYWQCRELLEISSSAKTNPEDKIQEIENDLFNSLLDEKAYNNIKWLYIDNKKYNLFNIQTKSRELLNQ